MSENAILPYGQLHCTYIHHDLEKFQVILKIPEQVPPACSIKLSRIIQKFCEICNSKALVTTRRAPLCCRSASDSVAETQRTIPPTHVAGACFDVNLEDFLTLGTRYCLISVTRGDIVCIDTGTYDTICISLTLVIRYIDVSVNRYTPTISYNIQLCYITSL